MTVAIVVYKGLIPVVGRILTLNLCTSDKLDNNHLIYIANMAIPNLRYYISLLDALFF